MFEEKRKILISGAGGFVGRALVAGLENDSRYELYKIVSKKNSFDAESAQKTLRLDIGDYETFEEAEKLENVGTLVHAAGLAHQFGGVPFEEYRRVNVKGTANMCRLARKIGVGHFILLSSVAVYGDHGDNLVDETYECRPEGFYAVSKLESEKSAIEFCESNDLRLTILRLATIVGGEDRGNTMRLITFVDKNRFIWIGRGINKKSLIYRDDVVRGIIDTIKTSGSAGTEIYNLTGETLAMREIVETISKALHKKALPVKIPAGLVRRILRLNRHIFRVERFEKFETTVEKWLSDDVYSGQKFIEKYKFKTRTAISEALSKQVEYYLEHKSRV